MQDKCFLATTQEQGVEGGVRQRDTHMWGIKSQEWASGETQGALPILATVGVDPDGAVSGGNNLPMRAVDAPLPGPF